MLAQLFGNVVLNTHGLILTGMCPVLALPLQQRLPCLFCSLAEPWLWHADLLMLRRGVPLQEHSNFARKMILWCVPALKWLSKGFSRGGG